MAVNRKKQRNKEIFMEYMHEKKPAEKIAQDHNISRQRVYQILRRFPDYEPRHGFAERRPDLRKHDYQKIYEFVSNFYRENYFPPSIFEIAKNMDTPHGTGTVHILDVLVEKGKLVKIDDWGKYVPAWAKQIVDDYFRNFSRNPDPPRCGKCGEFMSKHLVDDELYWKCPHGCMVTTI